MTKTADTRHLRDTGAPTMSDSAAVRRLRRLAESWAVDDDTYLHLDGPDLGYADAAVQILDALRDEDRCVECGEVRRLHSVHGDCAGSYQTSEKRLQQ